MAPTVTAGCCSAVVIAARSVGTATAATARALLMGFVDNKISALDRMAVQGGDCRLRCIRLRHRNKAKTTGATGLAVGHDLGVSHLTVGSEQGRELLLADAPGQIAHIDFGSHFAVCSPV